MVSNYESVQEKVSGGELRLIAIDSPARCGSTTIEIALTESPSVHTHIHQPFHLPYSNPYTPPADRENDAYSLILNAYEAAASATEERPIVIVAKEMTRNLGVGAQMERWHELADKQILLGRNPQLSIESLVRLDLNLMEDRPEAFSEPLNDYAKRYGFEDTLGEHQNWRDGDIGLGQHWRKMLDHVLKTRDYTPVGQLSSEFGINWDLNSHLQEFQDDYKEVFGQDIVDNMFKTSGSGWLNMGENISNFRGEDCIVVECTIMRTEPEAIFRELSKYAGIEFTERMVNGWTHATGEHFNRGATEPAAMPAYSAVLASDHIMRAKHTPVETTMFSEEFQEHLQDIAFPAYIDMLMNKQAVRPSGKEEIEKILNSAVSDEGDKLRDVDPIFAYAITATDITLGPRERSGILTDIRERDGERFGDVFDNIDSIVAKINMTKQTGQRSARG
jgi:hypothetical protein